ncbi:hypothetical protein [Flavobacterium sp. NKUCC04_CG]|uniref:hypothetical protein n=1 Tax=Flavobacterium sp. NKUCC04_CG TaxID=2842121 RepID=UPI002106F0CE|nr:hypothetical protein [Flavobacterium sp. NKUCC04_CG]
MKKYIKSAGYVILFFLFICFAIDQSRSFYKLEDGKEVTVWKRIGGICYVIPYKYYGIIKPSSCAIETVNTGGITLIWYNGKLIVNTDSKMKIINNGDCILEDYMNKKDENDSIFLYSDNGIDKLKSDLKYLSIYILDNSVYSNK